MIDINLNIMSDKAEEAEGVEGPRKRVEKK